MPIGAPEDQLLARSTGVAQLAPAGTSWHRSLAPIAGRGSRQRALLCEPLVQAQPRTDGAADARVASYASLCGFVEPCQGQHSSYHYLGGFGRRSFAHISPGTLLIGHAVEPIAAVAGT